MSWLTPSASSRKCPTSTGRRTPEFPPEQPRALRLFRRILSLRARGCGSTARPRRRGSSNSSPISSASSDGRTDSTSTPTIREFSDIRQVVLRTSSWLVHPLLHGDVGTVQLLRDARPPHPVHDGTDRGGWTRDER